NEEFQNKTHNATNIQKIIRSFLARKAFITKFNEILRQKALEKIILLQKNIKMQIISRIFKENYIKYKIIQVRREANQILSRFFHKINNVNKVKRKCILQNIILERSVSIITLQSNFK